MKISALCMWKGTKSTDSSAELSGILTPFNLVKMCRSCRGLCCCRVDEWAVHTEDIVRIRTGRLLLFLIFLLARPEPYPGAFIPISANYLPAVSSQNSMHFYRKSMRHIPEISLQRRALILNKGNKFSELILWKTSLLFLKTAKIQHLAFQKFCQVNLSWI